MKFFYYLFTNKRFLLFFLSIPLLFISILGPAQEKIFHLIVSFDFNSIKDLYYNSEDFFRTPNTPIRFILFTIAVAMVVVIPFINKPDIKEENRYISFMAKYLIILFMLSILSTSYLYNLTAVTLLFLSVFYLLFYSSKDFTRMEGYFLASYFFIFYYPFIHSFFIETNLSEIDNYLRFLFAVPIYCLVREIRIKEEYFALIVNHASLIIGLSAIYFYINDDSIRVRGYTSTATIFGNIALLFSCLSLLSKKSLNHSFFKYYPFVAAFFAFYAWSLTGARSSLLIIPVFLIIFFSSKDLRMNFFSAINFKFLSIFLVVLIGIFSQSTVFNRIVNSYETSYSYLFENGEYNWKHKDSLVPRLRIWKGSLNIIGDHPMLGVGLNNFNHYLVLQIKDKKIDPIRNSPKMLAAGLNHAHNQYLDIFVKTGIIGLITLIFFLFMNLLFFLKKYLVNKTCFYSKAGLFTIITYSTYMLNHTIISHQQSSLFLSFFLIILAGLSNQNNFKEKDL